jgi:hypothetical protein
MAAPRHLRAQPRKIAATRVQAIPVRIPTKLMPAYRLFGAGLRPYRAGGGLIGRRRVHGGHVGSRRRAVSRGRGGRRHRAAEQLHQVGGAAAAKLTEQLGRQPLVGEKEPLKDLGNPLNTAPTAAAPVPAAAPQAPQTWTRPRHATSRSLPVTHRFDATARALHRSVGDVSGDVTVVAPARTAKPKGLPSVSSSISSMTLPLYRSLRLPQKSVGALSA